MDIWGKKEYNWTSLFPSGPHIGVRAVEWKSGSCREYTDGVVYLLRALGIPAGIDRTLQRGDNNASHFWAFTIDKNGDTYITEPEVWISSKKHNVLKAKVARMTYSLNRELAGKIADMQTVYPTFRFPLFKDVSRFYLAHSNRLAIDVEDMYREVGKDEPVSSSDYNYVSGITIPESAISVSGSVDTDKKGTYRVTFKADYNDKRANTTMLVVVE